MMASAAANFHEAYSSAMRYGEEMASICATNVSHLMLHQWDMDAMLRSTANDLYQEARKVLRNLCETYQLDNLYVYRIDPEAPSRYYYLCASGDPEQDERLQKMLPLRTLPADRISEAELAVLAGAEGVQRGILNNQLGKDYAWFAPYLDSNGELAVVIGMDFSSAAIRRIILRDFEVDMIPFTLSLTVGLLILLFLVQRRIVNPIRAISDSMSRFARDSRIKPDPLDIPMEDEIGEIAASFEKMTEDISSYVNNIEALTRE